LDLAVTPDWPHTHTLSVSEDQVFLRLDDRLGQLGSVTINGKLQWQRRQKIPGFYVVERVPTGEAFAGAAVADWGSPDGKMFTMIFSPESRTVGINTIRLEAKHKNMALDRKRNAQARKTRTSPACKRLASKAACAPLADCNEATAKDAKLLVN
jgi:hypothetical protein